MEDVSALGPILLASMCLGTFIFALVHVTRSPEPDMVVATIVLLLASMFFMGLATYRADENGATRNDAVVSPEAEATAPD